MEGGYDEQSVGLSTGELDIGVSFECGYNGGGGELGGRITD